MRAAHPVGVPLRRVCLNFDESSRVPLTLTYPQVSRVRVLALIRQTFATKTQKLTCASSSQWGLFSEFRNLCRVDKDLSLTFFFLH